MALKLYLNYTDALLGRILNEPSVASGAATINEITKRYEFPNYWPSIMAPYATSPIAAGGSVNPSAGVLAYLSGGQQHSIPLAGLHYWTHAVGSVISFPADLLAWRRVDGGRRESYWLNDGSRRWWWGNATGV